jgi:hypothetical protein
MMMLSPFVIIPSLIVYRVHEYHAAMAQNEARLAVLRAEMQEHFAQAEAGQHRPDKP